MILLRQSSPKHRMFAPLPCLWGWSPVQDSIRVSITSLLGLLVLSMTFFPSVAGWTHWLGKFDAKGETTSASLGFNGIAGYVASYPLCWLCSQPHSGSVLNINAFFTCCFCY